MFGKLLKKPNSDLHEFVPYADSLSRVDTTAHIFQWVRQLNNFEI